MKTTLSAILLSIICVLSYAQNRKAFLTKEGSVTDSLHAGFYLLIHKVSDTAWTTRQYDMKNVMQAQGTYRDSNLALPHGTFLFYGQILEPSVFQPHNTTYLKTKGHFYNGQKDGTWIEYFENGNIESISTFVFDRMNGPFSNYDRYNRERARGINVNSLRDGVVEYLTEFGNPWRLEKYDNGERTKTVDLLYKEPTPPKEFEKNIENRKNTLLTNNGNVKLAISAVITADGKLTQANLISSRLLKKNLVNELYRLLESGLLWTPAYVKENNAKVDYNIWMGLEIDKSEIKLSYPIPSNFDLPLAKSPNDQQNDTLGYTLVSTEAEIVGGVETFFSLFRKHLNLNKLRESQIKIAVVIDKHGDLIDIRVSGGSSEKINREMVQIIRKNGKWEPAYKNGEPVDAEYHRTLIYTNSILTIGKTY